jgi:hypothetical protein
MRRIHGEGVTGTGDVSVISLNGENCGELFRIWEGKSQRSGNKRRAGFVDDMGAESFAVRQSIRILARSCEPGEVV